MAEIDLARIKRNVAKMAAQNAPVEDIDGYIASEGTTLEAVRDFRPDVAPVAPETAPSMETAKPSGQRYDASGVPVGGDPSVTPMGAPGNGTVPAGQPQLPGTDPVTRADNFVRGAADMMTFGGADEMAAAAGAATGVGGKRGDYAGNVAGQRAQDAQGGGMRLAGQVAGALAMPGMGAASVPRAIGQGAATGAAYGFGSGEGGFADRRDSAVVGGVAGGVAGGAVRSIANAAATRAARADIPSNEAIKAAGQAAYQAADDAGVIIAPAGMKRLADTVVRDLAEFGYDPALQPGVAAVVSRLGAAGEQNVTLKGVDVLRRVAQNAAQSNVPSERALASKIIGRIDEFVENLPDSDVLGGDARVAGAALKEARQAWSRLRKSEGVDAKVAKADLRAASTGSGGNADNATRQNVRQLLDNDKTARSMSATERAAAERVVRGTAGQNILRGVGKLAPTGVVSGGLGTSMGAGFGAMVGGAPGAAIGTFALPAVGSLAKALADRATVRNVERLSEVIRSGGRSAPEIAAAARAGLGPMSLSQAVAERIAKETGVPVSALAAALADRAGAY